MPTPTLRIAAVGDISLGDHPVRAGFGTRKLLSKRRAELLKDVKDLIGKADLTIGNLETVASDIGYDPGSIASHEMRGSPSSVSILKESGFDILGFANNHAMHHGRDAFIDTVRNLRNEGLEVIGLEEVPGRTNLYVADGPGGTQTCFFAVSMRPEERAEGPLPYSQRESEEKIINEVLEIRETQNGFIICFLHWGLEFLDYPSPDQRRFAHRLIDAGVDVIIGHHSHVLQPYEYHNDGLICYSLGNFLFDLWNPEFKETVIAFITLQEGVRPEICFEPVVIGEDCALMVPSSAADSNRIYNRLDPSTPKTLSDSLISHEEYEAIYRKKELEFRYSSYKFFIKNIFRYPMVFVYQSLLRTLFRRLSGE
ncbi:CapA family protein [uncultured Halovibrio sp.]|uniref:CapA family protein n=1 Tax=uncultured Halovibrio sp. TaxID=985049 RepID=UPI0025F7A360|nr:CapA family protein [uncultured Halovibrio sp.]